MNHTICEISSSFPELDTKAIRSLGDEGPTPELHFPELALEARVVLDDVETREADDLRDHGHAARTAARRLGQMPGQRQTVHIVAPNMASFDYILAILDHAAPATIADLAVSSLTISKANVEALCGMLDAGSIGTMDLLVGDYLLRTSPTIFTFAIDAFASRPNVRLRTCRTHAKILAAQLTDGRTVTIETSANLRSSRNLEQATATGDPRLFTFHRAWIRGVCDATARP